MQFGCLVIFFVLPIVSLHAKQLLVDADLLESLRADDNPCQDMPNGSFQKHPLGCKYFILCSKGNVNTGVCPNGLAFNPAKPPCDLASNVGCTDDVTTALPITTSTTTITTPMPTTTTTKTTQSPETTTTTTTTATTTTEPPSTTTTPTITTTTIEVPTTTTTTTPTRLPSTTATTTTTRPPSMPATTTIRPTTIATPTPMTTIQPIAPTAFPPITAPSIESLITCPATEDPRKIVFLPSNKDCAKYYICYHNAPVPMKCAPNLHWNIKTNQCDTHDNAKCTVSTMPSFYPVCPRDTVGLYPHPFKCELFLYCFHGHMTVQQCPFYYYWDVDKESCILQNIANCASKR